VRIARIARIALAAVALAAAVDAAAIEFRSIAAPVAIVHDGPSVRATRTHLVPRGTPVEVLSTIEGWTKVREPGGVLGWVESKTVHAMRTVVVTGNAVLVRRVPAADAPAVFETVSGLVLDWVDTQGGWVKVRHRDGLEGFVRAADVWGT
jgi:SH3-like domain-containing protein